MVARRGGGGGLFVGVSSYVLPSLPAYAAAVMCLLDDETAYFRQPILGCRQSQHCVLRCNAMVHCLKRCSRNGPVGLRLQAAHVMHHESH